MEMIAVYLIILGIIGVALSALLLLFFSIYNTWVERRNSAIDNPTPMVDIARKYLDGLERVQKREVDRWRGRH